MSPDERLRLTRAIPPDLTPEDVVLRHGNAMQGPSDPCWYVSIRGKAVPGFYTPEDVEKIILWFDGLKGAEEQKILGYAAFDAQMKLHTFWPMAHRGTAKWLYHTMMSRLWLYAPLIVQEG